ncbi:kynurenine--oxoglutarate transaminase 3 [Nilaparvata lugens]|uniref:kynurenine--oxoglutarate transaminase 3 n=1 Tax=Nilaparvata lugens TaxID=108931 RepID=UPI00193D5272|nr:kynurenine--oxoglutarate transaminase 3 [Nilaparvata lugens]XP_039288809.1 kynurenine--oxoglutarate transaminase 3 [Nilaparvata lugens]XP_039288810.1 kynurenine--oxoglutarate transaminase 3 [Nilaparvata lugens]XP_039288811.1 kynurenine--oxoglutarate transaminase 3 [Nilaparvata lugens]
MASPSGEKFKLPGRFGNIGNSVWNEFTQLAIEHRPVHLAQGFPDFPAPKHVTQTLEDVVVNGNPLLQQYTRGFGHPKLVRTLSKLYSKLIGREIDAFSEILITCGAYGALFSCIEGHTNPGDEFIIIEPFFDSYEPTISAAGGKPVYIPLRPKPNNDSDGPMTSADWVLDPDELASKFNSKTKAIIVNTPLNPIGKVFSVEELTVIANLCKKWNTLCISDEVYEWITYQPSKHVRIASLPDMWKRTITIGTAGKTLGVTGWKVGWAYGPANLLENLRIVAQNCVNSCATPLQEAVARCLELEMTRMDSADSIFKKNASNYESKRDFLVNTLTQIGMKPIIPEGGYFIVADWSSLESSVDLSKETDKYKDFRFAKYLTKNVGLLGIPPSAFYSEPNKQLASTLIRFCFVKEEETLQKAAKILHDWRTQK